MTRQRHRVNEAGRYTRPVPPGPAVPEWEALCQPGVLEARIEAIRLEQAEAWCSTCGSTASVRGRAEKWCPGCQRTRPLFAFSRNAARHDGLHTVCKSCDAARRRKQAIRRALRRTA